MIPPKTILVPTDLGDNAEQALDYAVELAARLDATIHVLNVIPLQVLGTEYGLNLAPSMIEDVLRTNRAAVDKLVAARRGRAAFGPVQVELGDVRAIIDAMARTLGADLIVMGTHGRRGVRRLLLGSVAESVVRESPCPVLLVRGR